MSGKNLSWPRLLTARHFEYEGQFHNINIKITLTETFQPANQKKKIAGPMPGLFPALPFS